MDLIPGTSDIEDLLYPLASALFRSLISAITDRQCGQLDRDILALPLPLGGLRGEKLNYKSVAKEISKPPFLWLLKSSGDQTLPCLFDSGFLQMFRTTPIFGMSRDHNRKRLKTRTECIVFEI